MSDSYDWTLTEAELRAARRAKPLPLDASWSTGDEHFDARIHATLVDVEARIAAAVAVEREACAQILDRMRFPTCTAAAAIRARGGAK